jgi:hypothetical protein
VRDQGIPDMGGIEEFINMDTLLCSHNQISLLDLSLNSALLRIDCSQNRLSMLSWRKNLLNSLDLSGNLQLVKLYCTENQLSTLNISNNFNLWFLDVTSMPTLYEVCVWEMPFPPEYILVNDAFSPNMFFTDVCSQ